MAVPTTWNYESVNPGTTNKPPLQQLLKDSLDNQYNGGSPLSYPGDYKDLLNYYYSLQGLVDAQVGRITTALDESGLAPNTVVVFTSDHGEYGGSHSMHDKAGAVYDEAIRVPLYVSIPGMMGNVDLNQMCSAVDFFGLMCDLATGGAGTWATTYPDLAGRESIYNYIFSNSAEQNRLVDIYIGGTRTSTPYILHTTDENLAGESEDAETYAELAEPGTVNSHVACIRTKTTNPSSTSYGNNGFKYAVYSTWGSCTTVPNATTPNYEYYDYQDSFDNRAELGNNYYGNTDPDSMQTLLSLQTKFGAWNTSSPYTGGTGIIGNELNVALTGLGTDGSTELNCVLLEDARPAYFSYLGQTCTAPSCP
jgi:hypothetical protein